MRRPIRRPQLDAAFAGDAYGQVLTPPSGTQPGPVVTESYSAPLSAPSTSSAALQPQMSALPPTLSGGTGSAMDVTAGQVSLGTSVVVGGGHASPPQQQGGGGARFRNLAPGLGLGGISVTTDRSIASTAASYVVSDSGAMFSLGNRYHVTSSGVQEFKRASCNLGVAASSESGLVCRHIDELDFDHGMQIGRGSSGKVYDVLHIPSGVRVCVKQMLIDDARHRDEIKRELDSLHKLPSRFIVDFYGAFFHHDLGVVLLVLELMDGSMQELMRVLPRLREDVVKAFALQIVHGLRVLHTERHLIHRDIKPGNILLHRSGTVKITDFGVSRGQLSHDRHASVHTFVGSVLYMSPERLQGQSYSFEADIWSLGIAVVECLTGTHPFQLDVNPSAPAPTFWSLVSVTGVSRPPGNPLTSTIQRLIDAGDASALHLSCSPEMADFVDLCLRPARDERPSAVRLLEHPWLQGMDLETSVALVSATAADARTIKQMQSQLPPMPSSSMMMPNGGVIGAEGVGSGAVVGVPAAAAGVEPALLESLPIGPPPTTAAQRRTEALLDDFVLSTSVGGK